MPNRPRLQRGWLRLAIALHHYIHCAMRLKCRHDYRLAYLSTTNTFSFFGDIPKMLIFSAASNRKPEKLCFLWQCGALGVTLYTILS